ncbi:hypothetical protein POX_f08201 [Penicillium oxalicum]|uniref:Uncharacterized protein n=1 Tax=Penicillium oxalicum (strain 114-2 / CGMCC 5302) TaxID=933388 RepID=S8B3N9_PENO1|nr:hypothetical protein POX_f08201 [Penicillium oxalicum]EPS29147.1 hypothetical protein PDE_04096 [Penicillium oxalicum 114-2]KAI2787823.1 hypothetical protein POX_f08201 [Penicillium oxalicum]
MNQGWPQDGEENPSGRKINKLKMCLWSRPPSMSAMAIADNKENNHSDIQGSAELYGSTQ